MFFSTTTTASVAMPSWAWALFVLIFVGGFTYLLKRWMERQEKSSDSLSQQMQEVRSDLAKVRESLVEVRIEIRNLPCIGSNGGGRPVLPSCERRESP